ncbi:hypothetical protein ABZ682_02465 [Streptomyces griseoviridis]|uniref:effector-associated constant component EACC1 n=1 Tax=Streptomyces TaxID=1883 RepID=UPI0024741D1C|nr:hypothetical protein [Streptomyces sp. MAA16]MDH6696593.1 hypothetical protein [Streptomyces sp. MAA16]
METVDEESATMVELSVHGPSGDQLLRTLRAWLGHNDAFRGQTELRRRPIAEGDMGGGLDVLVVALGSGGAATLLVQSVSTWLNQRRSDVTVTIRATDGREVSISVTRASDPLAVMREAERLVPLQPHE